MCTPANLTQCGQRDTVGWIILTKKKKSLRDYVFHEVRKFNNQVKS
jgi:hypothetical protein